MPNSTCSVTKSLFHAHYPYLFQEFLSKMKPCCGRSDGIFLFHSGIYSLVALRLCMRIGYVMWQGRRSVFVYDLKRICMGERNKYSSPRPQAFPRLRSPHHLPAVQALLFKLSPRSYQSCPLIRFSSRGEEKDLHFSIAIFFDLEHVREAPFCVVKDKQVTFFQVIF